ncbi:hypothetical protein ABKV19_025077, partial [Rosa sericea]
MLTEMRVLCQSTGDNHLVLDLGINFLTADDMLGILAIKLKKGSALEFGQSCILLACMLKGRSAIHYKVNLHVTLIDNFHIAKYWLEGAKLIWSYVARILGQPSLIGESSKGNTLGHHLTCWLIFSSLNKS